MLYALDNPYEKEVSAWLASIVVGLNLCPFAAWPLKHHQVRIAVSQAQSDSDLLSDIDAEIHRLDVTDAQQLETSLVVVPHHLSRFDEYLNMLEVLNLSGWDGVYQIASFHPAYCFEGAEQDDRENYTNRAPYPVFHLLREASVEKALAMYDGDPEAIPENNMETLRRLSPLQFQQLFQAVIR